MASTHSEAVVEEVLVAVGDGDAGDQQRGVRLAELTGQLLEYVVGVPPGCTGVLIRVAGGWAGWWTWLVRCV